MFPGLILTIGSVLFLSLLMIVYYNKIRLNDIQNRLYRYLLLTAVILLITEIIASVYFAHGHNPIIYEIVLRIHWSTGIAWFTLLYCYSICTLKELNYTRILDLIKDNVRCRLSIVFALCGTISYLLLPFKEMDSTNFTYIPGAAAHVVLVYCFISVIMTVLYMFFRAKEASTRKKSAIIMMIVELSIIFAFQLIFQKVAFLGLGAASQMFFLYFYIQNPDLTLIAQLRAVKETIDKSSKTKTDFLSNMSNEIITPINSIIGYGDNILNDNNFDKVKVKTDIEHILTASNNLIDIVNNILDISKIESGDENLYEREYSILAVVDELTSIIKTRIGSRPIKFEVSIGENTPSKIMGDQTKMFQILLNILSNSVKYTEVGKIKLSLTSLINKDIVTLNFRIYDTGFGIKKEDYDKLFEKFSRLDTATTNEIEGSGLGLVITKKYVDLMHGSISFESEYGAGTAFNIEIPQKIVDINPITTSEQAIVSKGNKEFIDCSNYRVLLVDDNKLNLKVAERLLKKYNFNVESVLSGKECVYKIKSGEKYDIIFLDHMMPEMDGIEVIHILKKLDDYDIPPIVALTANAITGVKEMYFKEGFDEYLPKPINVDELNQIILKYFKKDEKPVENSNQHAETIENQ